MILVYILSAILLTISLVVQGHTSFDVIRIAGVKPDLIFIVVVYLSYSFGSFYGEVTGFISGLFHDAVSNSPLGLLTLPKVIVAVLVGRMGRSIIHNGIVPVLILVFAASLIKGILTLILASIFHEASIVSVLHVIITEDFYNALLGPTLFALFDRIFEKELEREGNF